MRNNQPLYRFWGRTPPAEGHRNVSATEQTEATMYLYGPIDPWGGEWGISAAEVAAALTALPAGTTDLTLRINSPGGEVFEAVAIMNLLRDHSARITARVDGLAASAASFLAVSADELVMGANSELMIHDAWGLAIGYADDMRSYGDLLDHTSDNIASVYDAKAGGGAEQWRGYMKAESWFNAAEAVELGLADSVNTKPAADDAAAEPAARMAFDTETLVTYAGRDKAPAPAPTPVPTATTETPTPETSGVARNYARRHRHNARRLQRTA